MLENEEESFSFHKKEKFKEKVIANAAEDAAKRKKRKRMIKEKREQDLIGVIEDKEKKIKKKKVKKLIDEGKILLQSDDEAENPSDEILERFGALVDREEKLAENGPESNTELAYDGTLEAVQDGDVVLEGGGTFTSITGEAIIDGKLCKHPPYSVSLAIPGTFLNIGQSPELRTYMAGQIARAATVFCVDEIVVYDETAQMTQKQVDSYWSGDWLGGNPPSENNVEANFYLAKVLEYLECPQYLRKKLFYHHRALKYAGLLNPLDSEHHFKADDTVKYREGIVVNKRTRENKGVLVDVGLEQECWVPDMIPAGTRVTVEIDQFAGKQGGRLNKGRLISANKVKKATGQYWGYNVRIAKNLKQVIDRERYDYIFGTSSKGEPIEDIHINLLSRPKILIVFACRGVDQAVEIDEEIPTQNAEEVFDKLINPLPLHSGSGSERMEENVLITMSALTMKLKTLQ